MDMLYVILGLVFAVYGAQLLVDGGSAVARRFNIPTLVIGSTVVAFGTSMPEFTVNMHSALSGKTDLAMGNILGSNLFNICVIFGIVCLMTPLAIKKDSASKDFPMCLIAAIMVGVAGNQLYLDKIKFHELMLSDGITFLLFFAIFMFYIYKEAASGAAHQHAAGAGSSESTEETGKEKTISPLKSIVYIVLGLAGLVFGGEFIVDGATGLAKNFGLSERVIGLLIVGPGTSFPELIASIVAARKGSVDMVVGNVLGSNIFNIFFTLGVTSLIHPVPLDLALNVVVLVNIAVTFLLVMFAWFSRQKQMGRGIGSFLVLSYAAYIIYALMS
jgi:cation:H+ antiporter